MDHLRFIMVGGFLGAGKTTTLARLARFYRERGQPVRLVTNDQAQHLVHTHSLREHGLAVEEVSGLVSRQYPGVPVLRVSAKTGQGFDAVTELLDQQGAFGRRILDIDYDVYAEGEAELGWLNSSIRVTAVKPFDLDALLL